MSTVKGSKLLQVLKIELSDRADNEVYGTIKLGAPNCSHIIYDSEIDDPLVLSDGGLVLLPSNLSLPPEPIGASGGAISFAFDLKYTGQRGEEEFLNEIVFWESSGDNEDVIITDRLSCRGKLSFAVFSCAVAAHVRVSLINLKRVGRKQEDDDDDDDDGDGFAKKREVRSVYGSIVLSSSWVAGAIVEIFSEGEGEGVDVEEGKLRVEVCRSLFAAPVKSVVTVGGDLWDYREDTETTRRIAEGSADFHVRDWGSSTKIIPGEDCDIEVEISWQA